ncbi:MAG: ABC-type transport auxiliary lipoprotein family protein [Robiginitomaculum sp.]|nr:ABC-type transport auxiliary lipoprotein family protein [Robiginitomaculum sp.]
MRAKLVILAASLVLASCVSLLPKPGPDPDIFRLSEIALPDDLAASPVVMVELPRTPKALRNNRMAVIEGKQGIAYTTGARWAAAVPQIMAELLGDSMLATGRLNVVSPQEGVHPRYGLITEIRHFEIVYDQGAEAAPLGRVTIRAKLINRRSRTVIAQRHFDAQVRASENRLSAIAAAVDSAAHQGGRALGAWAANQLEAAEEAAKR